MAIYLLSHVILGLTTTDTLAQMGNAAFEISGGFFDFTDGNEFSALILYNLTRLQTALLKFVARNFILFALSKII